ncbi:MAG: hypothetical protein M3O67_04090, partial [Bacteroidota bacterium]|nr:hypothetical protein [Bacteroidota bacterium]
MAVFNTFQNRKTKKFFFRSALLLIAITFGAAIFLLLTLAGEKSKGPLDDLVSTVNKNISHFEKKIFDERESRSQSLQWFNRYRNNKVLMNYMDTILTGAYDDKTAESYETIVSLEDSL